MQLRAFLKQNNLTVKGFAASLDYSNTHLTMCILGKTPASKKLKRKILDATNGQVTAEEIVDADYLNCCPTCGRKWDPRKSQAAVIESDINNNKNSMDENALKA